MSPLPLQYEYCCCLLVRGASGTSGAHVGNFFLRASRRYVAAKIFPGAYGACIAYLGSHKNFRASRCYMRNLKYTYRLKRLL